MTLRRQMTDKMSTAKHRLLENCYMLAGIPKPGSLKHKPAREPRRPSYYDCKPVPIQPLPEPVPTPAGLPACGVTPARQPG